MELDSFWIGSLLVLILTGMYTMLGGMRAVVYTEALQTIVLITGSVLITYFGWQAIGGWDELRNVIHKEGDPAGYVEKFNLWKPVMPPGGHLGAGAGEGFRAATSSDRRGISTTTIPGWGC